MATVNAGSQRYQSVADLSFLSGKSEEQVLAEAERIGITIKWTSVDDVMLTEDGRRLLTNLNPGILNCARPGLSTARLIDLIEREISASELDLSNLTILTEAATGVYCVTPVIAAMAGAKRVHAVAKASRFGSVDEALKCIGHLAKAAGVAECISITESVPFEDLGSIDILTNSGHLRPITGALIERLPKFGVIALMYEAWEFRPDDLDLAACFQHGIPVVGVNERHPSLDVFSYLGELCAHHMHAAGVCVSNNKIALLCDNEFGGPIKASLEGLGGAVSVIPSVTSLYRSKWDAVVIALKPTIAPRIGRMEIEHILSVAPPSAAIIQFWGDVDRSVAFSRGVTVWPPDPPPAGHMAALLSELGPEPIVRLQTGGLRAAECIRRGCTSSATGIAQVIQWNSTEAL
jgi:hypothetical protein